jgi:outer membrane protein assembly factor BamB
VSETAEAQATHERILWTQEFSSGIDAPVVASDGTLFALDAEGHGLLWAIASDGTILARTAIKRHNFTALLIGDQGVVYVAGDTALGVDAQGHYPIITYLYAFNSAGTELWRQRLLPEGRTSRYGYGSRIALGSRGELLVGAYGDSVLYSVSPAGVPQWQLRLPSGICELAVGSDGTVYVCAAGGVYGVAPDGRLTWQWLSERPLQRQMALDGSGNVVVFASNVEGSLSPGGLFSVDAQGCLRGQVDLAESPYLHSSPVIDADGNILFLEPPAYYGQTMPMSILHSVTHAGNSYWRLPLVSEGFSALAVGADETVYVVGEENDHAVLYALDSVGGRERWSIEGLGGDQLTLSEAGVLYLPMGKYLYAIQTDSPGLADSPWPVPRADPRHTGRVSGPATAVLETEQGGLPVACRLGPSYPNPFNAGMVIPFELPTAGPAEVRVYDLLGQEVALLAKGWFAAGRHQVRWEPQGQGSAVYLCRLATPTVSSVQRLVLVK